MFLGHNKKLNPLFYVHEGVYAVFFAYLHRSSSNSWKK